MMYFHVSYADLGEKVVLIAKVPESASPKECQQTKRVCFSPSIAQCLAGKIGTLNLRGIVFDIFGESECECGVQNPAIYVTRRKLHIPEAVSDFDITQEAWSLADIQVSRKGYLNVKQLMLKGNVSVTQQPVSELSDDFLLGWRAGATLFSQHIKLPEIPRKSPQQAQLAPSFC